MFRTFKKHSTPAQTSNTDISASQLQTEKEELEIIAMNMEEGVILLDNTKNVILANRYIKEILNIDIESKDNSQVLKKFSEVLNINPQDYLAPLDKFVRVTKKEFDAGRKVYDVSFSLAPSESTQHYLIWVRDITQPKLLERAKTEFIALIAHQLRTPLTGTKWTLNMFLDGEIGEITPEQKGFISKLYDSNERLILITNDLLESQKLDLADTQYSFNSVQIFDIIDNLVGELKTNIQKKHITVNVLRNTVPMLEIDPDKIRLVFQNLLDNAVKYTMEEGTITIDAHPDNEQVVISITDTGVGIPKDQQADIFNRFYRASNAQHITGSGLGLFLVKKIIEGHGGKVWFESVESKGSTFYIALPLHRKHT
ncbi:GHKL domain-containing protein [Candidatus Parcubacteria bacterium]|nr:GHKL domain-containing protein [Candidatus Parcubacteria bacterium]